MTNPNTVAQQAVRNALSQVTTRWSQTLSTAQRSEWATYAANVPKTGPLGDPLYLSGQQWYVACNVLRLRSGLPLVDDGPGVMNMASLTPPVLTASNSTGYSVAFTNTDAWAIEDGGGLILQFSRPVSATINYFKGPFRVQTKIDGDSGTPPTSPTLTGSPFGTLGAVGSRVYMRAVATLADGRISPAAIVSDIVVA